ncbi:flagellar export protein FliJ [uncultured Microbulbifer sp.]|uniref:flagellar export protein FliJ n=1 Tax=uncultured Microbulbifer sp. TaxID=348147 RepID=UPI0026084A07|nr:flagellar export protein FliJ [uncultured Microbulbifer sp.]
MIPSRPLDILIDQSRKARDTAGRALAEERNAHEQTNAQLEMLQRYRGEYCERLQQAMAGGISASTLADYNRFIRSLDDAIAQARNLLSQQREKVDSSSEHWRHHQRKLTSFSALETRRTQLEQRQEDRRERRLADETTQNLLARRTPRDGRSPF